MKPKIEAREFWIEVKSFSSECLTVTREQPDRLTYRVAKDVIHVIEAQPALARIAELEAEVESLQADGLHTCHSKCQRIACVQRRKIANLETINAKLKACAEFYATKRHPIYQEVARTTLAEIAELEQKDKESK